ncbi:MAG: FHA domain-containing serine/threonine-protein kinase [Gemmataceae bacterium]
MSIAPTLAPPSLSTFQTGSLVGEVFGDFELLEELGRGGMGVVYKARQKSLDRLVAMKLLLAEHMSNPGVLLRFQDEARSAARLTHPNIVAVYAVGDSPAGPFFVMEFVEGPTLDTLVKRTLPVGWTVSLMATVAEAVDHAHSKGIIHRDLKPGNVMLHQQKRPVVMDFGIAKQIHADKAVTSPGAIVGTPAYMPPEQAGDEPGKIGPHSDVYSLGAILYTLLTGQVPYDEGTALRTILKVISPDPPPPVRSIRPDVPPRLEQITMKCLEKDIRRRYQSARALADDLKRFKAMQIGRGTSSTSLRGAVPTVLLTSKSGKQVRLFQPSTIIGRAQECDLVLRSADVSKKHCRILIGEDRVTVEDLGSVNGTLVNGRPVEKAKLNDGDKLDIAGHVFAVEVQRPHD